MFLLAERAHTVQLYLLLTVHYILAIWGLGGTLPGAHPVEVPISKFLVAPGEALWCPSESTLLG